MPENKLHVLNRDMQKLNIRGKKMKTNTCRCNEKNTDTEEFQHQLIT